MTAIRNRGELASPYFLLELWVRREEIDIDPETYATLKRRARALVRDARAFESRDERPDDDWRRARTELLALSGATDLELDVHSDLDISVWNDAGESDHLVVGTVIGVGDPDERRSDDRDPPSTAFELFLDNYDGDADWGILLAGLEIRIYRKSSGISQQYLAMDLDTLVEIDDEDNWRAFAGLFRAPAFAPGEEGVPLIRRVVDESRRHASALADDMRSDVVNAAEAIIQGALDNPANREVLGDLSRASLNHLFEETLYYLYRVLFILFAEARDVLPISAAGPYASTYSLDHLVELARSEPEQRSGSYYAQALQRLFDLLWRGPDSVASALGVHPVGGELFDPEHTSILDQCAVDDRYWRRALLSVALGAPDSNRRKMGKRSSFAELGVDQLGSIYEGLLVLEPFLAPGQRSLIKVDGDRRVVAPEDVDGLSVLRELSKGDFVLESASGRRKGSGSFYTPVEITEYLAQAAITPLVEPILEKATSDPGAAEKAILDLKICDPAMGSGAFLIQGARVLAVALARARAAKGDGRVTPAMVDRAKRAVIRRCVYGVDLNPLAVALAKVSLWLETLEKGQPLTFLDAHLRTGDSLVGVEFRSASGHLTAKQLTEWPKDAVKGLQNYLKNEVVKITRNGEEPIALDEVVVALGRKVHARLQDRKARKGKKKIQGEMTLPGIAATDLEAALHDIAKERHSLVEIPPDEDTLQLELELAERFHDMESEEDSVWNRLRAAADFWCAQWFWTGEDARADEEGPVVPPGEAEFDQIMGALLAGEPIPDHLSPVVEEAQTIAEGRHFFHWALEFPEVMLEQGGFDAVIGNPPWNTLSPDVKEYFGTYDPHVFKKGVPKTQQTQRKQELLEDEEIDHGWRTEARYLNELSHYAKPESGHYLWYAEDGQLRKGDANVFRQFVERAYLLLRREGHLAQVLPDSFYVSSPATGLRRHLLDEAILERCYVFENRRHIFPIDSRIRIALVTAERGTGPTERFRAAFFVGKNPAGQDRSIGLEELPSVLAELDEEAALLSADQIKTLAPDRLSFPELQSALDAEIATHCATTHPSLNSDGNGWGLEFCTELHADRDAWRFKTASDLADRNADRDGVRWKDPDGSDWWPLVEGTHLYHLEFPMEGKEPNYWVRGAEVASINARQNPDGTSVTAHYRVAWRDVAASTNERTVVACVIPPRTAAKHKAPTVWGGSLSVQETLKLAALLSSFVFDYLARMRGSGSMTYALLNSIPAPRVESLDKVVRPTAEIVRSFSSEFDGLWENAVGGSPPSLNWWAIGSRRAQIDAEVAIAYGLTLEQFVAALSTFPNVDTIQPMLPSEPKSFVTRDLALLAYCELTDQEPADISKLLREIGVDLPEPLTEYRLLDTRVTAYQELGAIPYRPTPRGGRPPTDPALIEAVQEALSSDAATASDIADMINEKEDSVRKVLEELRKGDEAYAEGRGKSKRYYVIET